MRGQNLQIYVPYVNKIIPQFKEACKIGPEDQCKTCHETENLCTSCNLGYKLENGICKLNYSFRATYINESPYEKISIIYTFSNYIKAMIVDGEEFDSQLEANRWYELKLLQRAKQIEYLRRQVKFELQPSYKRNGKTVQAINYIADFVYYDLNKKKFIVEDTKGFKTETYKLKKKIFEYIHPELEITEIYK